MLSCQFVLTPPILFPDYWLICPTCVYLVSLLVCSLYNLLVFAFLCQFIIVSTLVVAMLPCLALPCPALPCPALPCLALPCLALPCLALPCLALPCPALPCPALPCPALPSLASSHGFPLRGSFCCLFNFMLLNTAHSSALVSPRLIPSSPTLTYIIV